MSFKEQEHRMLLGLDYDLDKSLGKGFDPPLFELAYRPELVGLIEPVIDSGVNVNAERDTGATPLFAALSKKNWKAAKIFLNKNAKADIVKQRCGCEPNYYFCPLIYCLENPCDDDEGKEELLDFLLEKGADPNASFEGRSVLDTVFRMYGQTAIYGPESRNKIRSWLIKLAKGGAQRSSVNKEYQPYIDNDKELAELMQHKKK